MVVRMIDNIEPYFGLSRTMYLQTLCNRWGSFGVSWNFVDENGEQKFTRKRQIIELWSEEYSHPTKCRLENVMHRESLKIEYFVEIDDDNQLVARMKKDETVRICIKFGLEYCVYKSRKGYHISVLDVHKKLSRYAFITHVKCDPSFTSSKATWSLEWTQHWKQKDFVIKPVQISKRYVKVFLRL